jgi:16S rRNA (uracil1498-N3)-methyltransferase
MKHRLYLEEVHEAGQQLPLGTAESHYLLRVLRQQRGAEFICFNGSGAEWRASITSIDGRRCHISVHEMLREQPQPLVSLQLAQAWLKSSAMDVVVQKATELGITDLWPLTTARSNIQPQSARVDNKLRHWRRITRSACEQSGRLFLPQIHQPDSLGTLLNDPPTSTCLFLDLDKPPLRLQGDPCPLTIVIGPEGGWTDEERTLALSAGATLCGLGDLTLRAETVTTAVLAAIRHSWGWRLG